MRLERQRTEDVHQSMHLLQRHFDELVEVVLSAGRERGYLGTDPLGALETVRTPPAQDLRLSHMVAELWQTFFSSFRADEVQFEAARFAQQAEGLQARLANLGSGEAPDQELAVELVTTLLTFWEERQRAVNERIDTLIQELSQYQQRLGSADLQQAYQSDEHDRCRLLVATALQELGDDLTGQEPLAELLLRLVRTWRDLLRQRSQELTVQKEAVTQAAGQHEELMRVLALAANGKPVTTVNLSQHDQQMVESVLDLVVGFREQDQLLKRSQSPGHTKDPAPCRAGSRIESAQLKPDISWAPP